MLLKENQVKNKPPCQQKGTRSRIGLWIIKSEPDQTWSSSC